MSEAAESKLGNPLFKFAFRVPCSEYANLGANKDWMGKDRVTTVVNGLSIDWCLDFCPNGLSNGEAGFFVGLKLVKPSFELERLNARFELVQARYEGEKTWRKGAKWDGPSNFLDHAFVVQVPSMPDADPNRREQVLRVEMLVEVEAWYLTPKLLLPLVHITPGRAAIVPKLMASVKP